MSTFMPGNKKPFALKSHFILLPALALCSGFARADIHRGAQYLRDLLRMFDNNLDLALAAYNAGEQAVMKYGNRIPPYRETLAYVPKVMKFYKRYSTGHASAEESGYKRLSTASRKKSSQTRVSRTYMANPA